MKTKLFLFLSFFLGFYTLKAATTTATATDIDIQYNFCIATTYEPENGLQKHVLYMKNQTNDIAAIHLFHTPTSNGKIPVGQYTIKSPKGSFTVAKGGAVLRFKIPTFIQKSDGTYFFPATGTVNVSYDAQNANKIIVSYDFYTLNNAEHLTGNCAYLLNPEDAYFYEPSTPITFTTTYDDLYVIRDDENLTTGISTYRVELKQYDTAAQSYSLKTFFIIYAPNGGDLSEVPVGTYTVKDVANRDNHSIKRSKGVDGTSGIPSFIFTNIKNPVNQDLYMLFLETGTLEVTKNNGVTEYAFHGLSHKNSVIHITKKGTPSNVSVESVNGQVLKAFVSNESLIVETPHNDVKVYTLGGKLVYQNNQVKNSRVEIHSLPTNKVYIVVSGNENQKIAYL